MLSLLIRKLMKRQKGVEKIIIMNDLQKNEILINFHSESGHSGM